MGFDNIKNMKKNRCYVHLDNDQYWHCPNCGEWLDAYDTYEPTHHTNNNIRSGLIYCGKCGKSKAGMFWRGTSIYAKRPES